MRNREGFFGAPKPLGFDIDGNEIVSYIAGQVSNYPLSEAASSAEALISAAELLRSYHDASASFLNKLKGDETKIDQLVDDRRRRQSHVPPARRGRAGHAARDPIRADA